MISLDQSNKSLALKVAPPNADDVTVAKSQLDNAKANLANAEEAYNSRIIVAPFTGQIGGLNAQIGQQVSSSDSLGKIITPEKVVNVSLNEVDAAKVKAGDAVTLTFDAIPDISLNGHVSYVDPLGTVSQGVVSYAVQIAMDETNDGIKTGMTASATIVTNKDEGVLVIPTTAISTSFGNKYVTVVDSTSTQSVAPVDTNSPASVTSSPYGNGNFGSSSMASTSHRFRNGSSTRAFSNTTNTSSVSSSIATHDVQITTGISNDTSTEILSGLSEGQTIVVRKNTSSATTAKSSASSATTRSRGMGGIPGL